MHGLLISDENAPENHSNLWP